LSKLLKNSSKLFEKNLQKLLKNYQKNSAKKPSRAGKKIFFSKQTKNNCKLIFNQNKKKKFFFLGLGEKKFIKNPKSQNSLDRVVSEKSP
jgi:hypothetical protein